MEETPKKSLISGSSAKSEHSSSSGGSLLSLDCPWRAGLFNLYIPKKMPREVLKNGAPAFGGWLCWSEGKIEKRHKLSVTAATILEGMMGNNFAWFDFWGEDEIVIRREGKQSTFKVVSAMCSFPILLSKWAVSIESCTLYHQEGTGRAKCPTGKTFAIHEITHFGEVPHSIRHLLRGGHLYCSTSDETTARLLRTMQQTNEKATFEQAETKLVNLHKGLKLQESLTCLIPLAEERIYVQQSPPWGLEQFNHTDLHFAQVPDSPIEFAMQVLAESEFPQMIANSEGYDVVEQEVIKLLGDNRCNLIVWHRNVPGLNRVVTPKEHLGCELGGIEAIEAKTGEKAIVLHLGDKDSECMTKGISLLGCHMEDIKGGRRNMLQQIQFLHAVVKISGAQLIVSERAGLADLLCLASGTPMCQFIAMDVRVGNSRLDQVCMSGSGMSFAIAPWSDPTVRGKSEKIVSNSVSEGCLKSMDDHEKLSKELGSFKASLPDNS